MESKNLQKRSTKKPSNIRSRIYSKNYGSIINLQKTISKASRYRDDPDEMQ